MSAKGVDFVMTVRVGRVEAQVFESIHTASYALISGKRAYACNKCEVDKSHVSDLKRIFFTCFQFY